MCLYLMQVLKTESTTDDKAVVNLRVMPKPVTGCVRMSGVAEPQVESAVLVARQCATPAAGHHPVRLRREASGWRGSTHSGGAPRPPRPQRRCPRHAGVPEAEPINGRNRGLRVTLTAVRGFITVRI